VLEGVGVAKIFETGHRAGDDAKAPLDLAQEQPTTFGGDAPAVETALNSTPANVVEIESGLSTLCHRKAAPVSGFKLVLDKQFVSETAALFYFIGEICGLAASAAKQSAHRCRR
jgi:hypothetical protein